jgi:hypothetical protein
MVYYFNGQRAFFCFYVAEVTYMSDMVARPAVTTLEGN